MAAHPRFNEYAAYRFTIISNFYNKIVISKEAIVVRESVNTESYMRCSMEHIFFCTVCGSKMDPRSAYCPACGAPVSGTNPHSPARSSIERYEANSKLKTVTMLLMVGAAFSLLSGLLYLAMVDMAAEVYDSVYTNVSLQDLQTIIRILGYVGISCGIMCFLPAIVVMKRVGWALAFVLTLIAAAFGFITTIIGGILGVLCLYYIYKYRFAFE